MGFFESEDERNAWSTASLRYLGGRLSFPSYVLSVPSDEQLDFARRQLASTREWVKTISDRRMQKECGKWCNHSQHCIDECESEKRTGRFQKSMDAIGDDWKRSDNLADKILSSFR